MKAVAILSLCFALGACAFDYSKAKAGVRDLSDADLYQEFQQMTSRPFLSSSPRYGVLQREMQKRKMLPYTVPAKGPN